MCYCVTQRFWWTPSARRAYDVHINLSKNEGLGSDLQRGDGLVSVHQVRHDGLQRAVPLAGGSGTRAGVRPELAHLLVIGLLAVVERQQAAGRRVLRGGQENVRGTSEERRPETAAEHETAAETEAKAVCGCRSRTA